MMKYYYSSKFYDENRKQKEDGIFQKLTVSRVYIFMLRCQKVIWIKNKINHRRTNK